MNLYVNIIKDIFEQVLYQLYTTQVLFHIRDVVKLQWSIPFNTCKDFYLNNYTMVLFCYLYDDLNVMLCDVSCLCAGAFSQLTS